jgi:hypothetical protein
MYESLQSLKDGPLREQARAALNKNRDDILENAFRRGLPQEAQFKVSREGPCRIPMSPQVTPRGLIQDPNA